MQHGFAPFYTILFQQIKQTRYNVSENVSVECATFIQSPACCSLLFSGLASCANQLLDAACRVSIFLSTSQQENK